MTSDLGSRSKYTDMFFQYTVGLSALLSKNADVIQISKRLLDLQDLTYTSAQGKSFFEVITSDKSQVSIVKHAFEAITQLDEPVHFEIQIPSSGIVLTIAMIFSPIHDAEGNLSYVFAEGFDISQQKSFEATLSDEQAFKNAILDNTADAIISFDAFGNRTYSNAIARQMFAIDENPGLRHTGLELVFDIFATKSEQLLSSEESSLGLALQGIEVKNLEIRIQPKDQLPEDMVSLRSFQPKSLSVSSRIIRDQDGEISSIIISYKDITEQTLAENSLVKTNQRLAGSRDEERRRLARELHDGIVQDLMGFSYDLANFEHLLATKDDFNINTSDLKVMRYQLTTSIKQLRTFVGGLRPVGLEEFGFRSALESYVALLERDKEYMYHFPTIRYELEDVGELLKPLNLCLFRTAQQGLVNTLRHARAKNVLIQLKKLSEPNTLVLSIQDDGIGFEVPEDINEFSENQHFGLIGIKERVALLEGEVAIESTISQGTTLKITLPFDPKD